MATSRGTTSTERPTPARPAAHDARLRDLTVRLLGRVLPEPSPLPVRLWDGTVIGSSDRGGPVLVLHEPSALAALLTPPLDLSAGEAYLRGEIGVEGDLEAAFAAIDGLESTLSVLDWPRLAGEVASLRRAAGRSPLAARLRGRPHTRSRDRQAIAHHYDVSNDFYCLWLGERMVYSCAYFPEGEESLDTAQEAKLDLICRKLDLREGQRLLDIGCGWGGLVLYAAERYGVSAVGVTLSEAQRDDARSRVAAAGLDGRVRIELLDYRDVEGEFDAVASVGMAEHVGRSRLGDYFRSAWDRVVPGGTMLNHAISTGPRAGRGDAELFSGAFARRYVFPDGEIVPLWEVLRAAEACGFEVRDVEDLREHYATTLRHWVRNLESAWERAVREVGPERSRLWRLFMTASAHRFAAGRLAVHQTLLAKPDENGRVRLPRSRAALYRP